MDRSYEPPATYEEMRINTRMVDQVSNPRSWSLPVPLRVRHSGFKGLGVTAPLPPGKTECFTLPLRGTPHILGYQGGRNWLVTMVTVPGGSTPKDPFAGESPVTRVDGDQCKGILTFTSTGVAYMGFIDITRATLGNMAARVLDREPDSRILVRLLPRYAHGAVRFFRDLGCFQFWTAI